MPDLKSFLPNETFEFADGIIRPGSHEVVHFDFESHKMPVHILHGMNAGITISITGAVHGNEITGIEICRRLIETINPKLLTGTLIIVPVTNVMAMEAGTRMSEGIDLNRNMASVGETKTDALAEMLKDHIYAQSQYIIDLHSAQELQIITPQIRVDTSHAPSAQLAGWFDAPMILQNEAPENSIRDWAMSNDIGIVTYEGGKGLEVDLNAVEVGLEGVMNVLGALRMLGIPKKPKRSEIFNGYKEYKSPIKGIWVSLVEAGHEAMTGEVLGFVFCPFSLEKNEIVADTDGIVQWIWRFAHVEEESPVIQIAVA